MSDRLYPILSVAAYWLRFPLLLFAFLLLLVGLPPAVFALLLVDLTPAVFAFPLSLVSTAVFDETVLLFVFAGILALVSTTLSRGGFPAALALLLLLVFAVVFVLVSVVLQPIRAAATANTKLSAKLRRIILYPPLELPSKLTIKRLSLVFAPVVFEIIGVLRRAWIHTHHNTTIANAFFIMSGVLFWNAMPHEGSDQATR